METLSSALLQFFEWWVQHGLDQEKIQEFFLSELETFADALVFTFFERKASASRFLRLFSMEAHLEIVAFSLQGDMEESAQQESRISGWWRQITDTLSEGLYKRPVIFLPQVKSIQTHERLFSKASGRPLDLREHQGVAFTCGHYFSRPYFSEEMVPSFQERMSNLLDAYSALGATLSKKGGELSRPSSSSDLQVATGDLDSISSAASEESSELGCGETPVAQAPGAGPTSGAGAFSQSTLALHQECFEVRSRRRDQENLKKFLKKVHHLKEIRDMFSDAGNQRKVKLAAICRDLVAAQDSQNADVCLLEKFQELHLPLPWYGRDAVGEDSLATQGVEMDMPTPTTPQDLSDALVGVQVPFYLPSSCPGCLWNHLLQDARKERGLDVTLLAEWKGL